MNKYTIKLFFISSYLILMSFSKIILANDFIDKTRTLSATIEHKNFFSFTIKEFYFEDRSIDIDIDYKNNKLIDKSTHLIIKTDAPSFFPAGYMISAEELSSICKDSNGKQYSDIARYYLGGKRLIKNFSVSFDDFITTDNFLWVKKDFNMKFNSVNPFNVNSSRCSGKVVLRAQLEL
ncbi:hypothetical protein [Photobacterium damselae]|uniref:hypothetical protein n=1 Tax=Photobacterium damselae TaxID=38293 RepID=UPI0040694E43